MKKAIFLDRDGVINKLVVKDGVGRAPYNIEDFYYLPKIKEACLRLKELGFIIIVITNQPDVRRGWVTQENVEFINQLVLKDLAIDCIKVCFHDNSDNCLCRKPKPGMILEAASEWGIDLSQSFLAGDRYGDIEAGKRSLIGSTILIGDPGDAKGTYPDPNFCAKSLYESLPFIESQLELQLK